MSDVYSGKAETPYAGTSGHSGSDTSEARVRRDDQTGVTAKNQQRALGYARFVGAHGITVGEFGRYADIHHGKASAALSVLHKAGHLARLKRPRQGAKVYVLPELVGSRDTEPHGRPNKAAAALQEKLDRIKAEAEKWIGYPCEANNQYVHCRHCAAEEVLRMIGDKP